MNLTGFNLSKNYFDCIDDEGNCFIVYWAKLEFSLLKLNYSGIIFSNSQNLSIEKSSLKKIKRPIVNDLMQFKNPALKINGNWERLENPYTILLYTDAKGNKIFWDCHHPKTYTNIEYKDNSFKGLGYAETLTMEVKPWKLPIDELRWGRFLSENTTIIWINWKGNYPLNKIIYNGITFEDAIFDENKIMFNNNKSILSFEEKTIIRKGKLANVLARMPWLKLIFKSKILNTIEIKYKSRTSFSIGADIKCKGWSLYEVVTF